LHDKKSIGVKNILIIINNFAQKRCLKIMRFMSENKKASLMRLAFSYFIMLYNFSANTLSEGEEM